MTTFSLRLATWAIKSKNFHDWISFGWQLNENSCQWPSKKIVANAHFFQNRIPRQTIESWANGFSKPHWMKAIGTWFRFLSPNERQRTSEREHKRVAFNYVTMFNPEFVVSFKIASSAALLHITDEWKGKLEVLHNKHFRLFCRSEAATVTLASATKCCWIARHHHLARLKRVT